MDDMFPTYYCVTVLFGVIDFAFFSIFEVLYMLREVCKGEDRMDNLFHILSSFHSLQVVLVGYIIYILTPLFIEHFKGKDSSLSSFLSTTTTTSSFPIRWSFHYNSYWIAVPLTLFIVHILTTIKWLTMSSQLEIGCRFGEIGANVLFSFMSILLVLWIFGPIKWLDKLTMSEVIYDEKKGVEAAVMTTTKTSSKYALLDTYKKGDDDEEEYDFD